jgi:hypothetical protein
MPTEKLGEKIEKIRFRFDGFDISDARILFNTPAGLRPTGYQARSHDLRWEYSQTARQNTTCHTLVLNPTIPAAKIANSCPHSIHGLLPHRSANLAHVVAIAASTSINTPSPNPA